MSASRQISIVIADDHPIFRAGLKLLISAEADMRVVADVNGGRAAVDAVRSMKPDVLLLDVAMPVVPGLQVLRELREQLDADPPVRAILLTAGIDIEQQMAALEYGARGIILKDTVTELLFKCIRAVMTGEYWVRRESMSTLVIALRKAKSAPRETNAYGLTPRQMEIVREVAQGATNREIAAQLGIREDTIKQQLRAIYDKCGTSSRVELALFAVHHGLTNKD